MQVWTEFKKHLLILGLIFIFLGSIFTFLFFSNSKTPSTSVYEYFPRDPIFVLQINSPVSISKKLITSIEYWNYLKNVETFDYFNKITKFIDSMTIVNSENKNIFNNSFLALALYQTGNQNYEYIYAFNISNDFNLSDIKTWITESVNGSKILSPKPYEDQEINQILINNSKFFFVLMDEKIFLSQSEFILEDVIRKKNPIYSLYYEPDFKELYQKISKYSDFNLFINYYNLGIVLNEKLKFDQKKRIDLFQNFANWSQFDMNFKDNGISLFGITVPNIEKNNYITIFDNQTPQRMKILKIIPQGAFSCLYFGFNDFSKFNKEFKKLLEKRNQLYDYQINITRINNKLNHQDIEEKLLSWIDNELALFSIDWENKKNISYSNYLAFKSVNVKQTQKLLEDLSIDVAQVQKKILTKESYLNIPIKELNLPGYYGTLLGEPFNVIEEKFYCILDDYIIFAENTASLINLINAYSEDKVLSSDVSFLETIKEIVDESNIFYLQKFPQSLNSIYKYSNTSFVNDIKSNRKFFNFSPEFIFQFNNTSNKIFTNVNIRFFDFNEKVYKENFIWKTDLDRKLITPPTVVEDHRKNEKMILIQDERYNLIMVDNLGKILNKISIKEKIESEIFTIDYYNNGKNQFFFNTQNYLYLIDVLGNNVDNYPIALKSQITSPVNIFDYSNNKDYRIFFTTKDNKVHILNKKGEKRSGWGFNNTQNIVNHKIQYFKFKNKDYIIIRENQGNTYILDRLGNIIATLERKIEWSENNILYLDDFDTYGSILSTDKYGFIVRFNFNGKVTAEKLTDVSEKHFFLLGNYNNNRTLDYFISDYNKLNVFEKNNLIFEEKFNKIISSPPLNFSFSNKVQKFGIVSSEENMIYLYNNDGSIQTSFPKYGSNIFTISKILPQSSEFQMITTGSDNFLYLYAIEN